MKVTRQMMLNAVAENVSDRANDDEASRSRTGKMKNLAGQGNLSRLKKASALLLRLQFGEPPTTREVVGYFGKGARFAE